jgi:hypothetical protein
VSAFARIESNGYAGGVSGHVYSLFVELTSEVPLVFGSDLVSTPYEGCDPRPGYAEFIMWDVVGKVLRVRGHRGWTPTNGDLLCAAKRVPAYEVVPA